MLKAKIEQRHIEAISAVKGPEYTCPCCHCTVILKKGRIRVPHFSHKATTNCAWAHGETQAHLEAKAKLKDAFVERGLRAEVEYELDCLPGDRRADIMVWSPHGWRVAIEIQHSPIEIGEIEERTRSYIGAGVGVIWISTLKPSIFKQAYSIGESNLLKVDRYSARQWERWGHGYYFGELWFYDQERKCLWKGRLGRHQLQVEETSWFDSDGNENYGGGYPRTSKRWKELLLIGPISLGEILIKKIKRRGSRLGIFSYPEGQTATFTWARQGQ